MEYAVAGDKKDPGLIKVNRWQVEIRANLGSGGETQLKYRQRPEHNGPVATDRNLGLDFK